MQPTISSQVPPLPTHAPRPCQVQRAQQLASHAAALQPALAGLAHITYQRSVHRHKPYAFALHAGCSGLTYRPGLGANNVHVANVNACRTGKLESDQLLSAQHCPLKAAEARCCFCCHRTASRCHTARRVPLHLTASQAALCLPADAQPLTLEHATKSATIATTLLPACLLASHRLNPSTAGQLSLHRAAVTLAQVLRGDVVPGTAAQLPCCKHGP